MVWMMPAGDRGKRILLPGFCLNASSSRSPLRASKAAARPMIPALLLCVWTMSGLSVRISSRSSRQQRRSLIGSIWRTMLGMVWVMMPRPSAVRNDCTRSSNDPSGP